MNWPKHSCQVTNPAVEKTAGFSFLLFILPAGTETGSAGAVCTWISYNHIYRISCTKAILQSFADFAEDIFFKTEYEQKLLIFFLLFAI